MECEYCGSHQVKMVVVQGHSAHECGLCGEIFGASGAVKAIKSMIESKERHIEPEIFEYVQLIETIAGFKVVSAGYGDEFRCIPPYIAIAIDPDSGMPFLEKFVFSVEHANLYTRERWVIEVGMKKGMQFELKPAFSHITKQISPDMISRARQDLETLQKTLERDTKLAWWYTRSEGAQ